MKERNRQIERKKNERKKQVRNKDKKIEKERK